jgi:MFS family permease
MLPDRARWNVLLLALCQALFTTSNAVVVTASALAGQQLAPGSGLATLPFSLQFVATMAVIFPASMLMKRLGRRVGFALGAACGLASGVLGCLAILGGRFGLFCLAGVLYGGFIGCAQYYRFAAADASDPAQRPRAIGYVLAGGVIAALAGPELAKATSGLFAPVLFAGCYAAVAALALATLGVLALITIPRPSAGERSAPGRPLREIARQPNFVVALLGAMVAYGAMSLIMTATPLAMVACAHGFTDAAFVIQWHILGMFAPSFISGRLIGRFGAGRVMLVGCGLMLACVAISLSDVTVARFWAALLLLGVGWNFLFVGATTLLTTSYEVAEKAKVQAVNDLLVFGTVALASLSSGALQHLVGWAAVNLGVVPPLLGALGALLWLEWLPREGTRKPLAAS